MDCRPMIEHTFWIDKIMALSGYIKQIVHVWPWLALKELTLYMLRYFLTQWDKHFLFEIVWPMSRKLQHHAATNTLILYSNIIFKQFAVNPWVSVFCDVQKVPKPFKRKSCITPLNSSLNLVPSSFLSFFLLTCLHDPVQISP